MVTICGIIPTSQETIVFLAALFVFKVGLVTETTLWACLSLRFLFIAKFVFFGGEIGAGCESIVISTIVSCYRKAWFKIGWVRHVICCRGIKFDDGVAVTRCERWRDPWALCGLQRKPLGSDLDPGSNYTSTVAADKLLNFFKPEFPYPWNRRMPGLAS